MINRNIVLFAISGVVGFIVDAGFLSLLKGELGLYLARAVSFFLAVVTTWLINRTFTFKGRPSNLPLHLEFSRYFIAMIFGGVINYISYVLAINLSDFVAARPVIGVAIGSLTGMLFNWLSSNKFIFKNMY